MIAEMQVVLDEDLIGYNTRRPHQGRGMNGRIPIQAFTQGFLNAPKTEATKPTSSTKIKAAQNPIELRLLSGEYPLFAP